MEVTNKSAKPQETPNGFPYDSLIFKQQSSLDPICTDLILDDMSSVEDKIFEENNIVITRTIASFGGETYFLDNLVSVRVTGDPKMFSFLLVVAGIMVGVFAFADFANLWHLLAIGIGLIAFACMLGFYRYFLTFDTASGSVNAYRGKPPYLLHLKAKIEEAKIAQNQK